MEIDENTTFFTEVMKQSPKRYNIDSQFQDLVKTIELPQFFLRTEKEELSENILFEELATYDYLLNKNSLLKGFNLLEYDTKINFDEISADIYAVDFDISKGTATASKVTQRAKNILVDTILSKPKENQIKEVSKFIVSKLGDMTPISQQDLTRYVGRVFESLSNDQIRDIINNEFIYIQKIKNKINDLSSEYSKQRFRMLLDSNEVFVKDNFSFTESINPINLSTSIGKSLYEREDTMNSFEQDMIMTIATMENIVFWHRNLTRGKGFFINGYYRDHYPDFIIYTQKGNIVLIETKGDHLDNEDSRDKNKLGKIWAEKAGDKYKYFMVFQTKQVTDCYTASSIIEVLKRL
jgi:type III restriction enzyme